MSSDPDPWRLQGLEPLGDDSFTTGDRKYDARSASLTPTQAASTPSGAIIEATPDGGFLQIISYRQFPSTFVQRQIASFDSSGNWTGARITETASLSGPNAFYQDLAVNPAGGFAIAHQNQIKVYSPAWQVVSTMAVTGSSHQIEYLGDGTLVDVWMGSDASGFGIFAQRFDQQYIPVSAPARINVVQAGDQFSPQVQALPDGRFVVAWTSPDGDGRGLFGAIIRDGSDGSDTLSGTSDSEALIAHDGDDVVHAFGGDDSLEGGAGNDLLSGGPGADVIDGGAGSDTLSFVGATTGMTLQMGSLGPNSGQVFAGEPIGMDTFSNIEHVLCGNEADTVGCDGQGNFVAGFGGNDTVFGWTGGDTLWGGDGEDQLFGQQDDDVIQGDAGNDKLFGWAGDDTLTGGAGADSFMWTGPGESLDAITDYSYAEGDLIDVVGDPNTFIFYQAGTSVLIIDPATGLAIFDLQNYNLSNGLAIV
jgi:Ca2+-binding RTX toxin-like protein